MHRRATKRVIRKREVVILYFYDGTTEVWDHKGNAEVDPKAFYKVTRTPFERIVGKWPHLVEYEQYTGKTKKDGSPQPNQIAIHTSHLSLWPEETNDLRGLIGLNIAYGLCAVWHWREWDQKRGSHEA